MDLTSVLALHQAAKQNVYENIISLINIGAEVDERDAKSGQTALHIAAALNNVEAVKALLDAGAEVDVVDCGGDTPLALARKCNKAESVQLLEGASQHRHDSGEVTTGCTAPSPRGEPSATSTLSGGWANGSTAASSASAAAAGGGGQDKARFGVNPRVDGRRKMKLHLESGTGLFEQPPVPAGAAAPLSPKTSARGTIGRTLSPPTNTLTAPRKPLPTVTGAAGPGASSSSSQTSKIAFTLPSAPQTNRLSSSDDGDSRISTPAGGWKKKDWNDAPGGPMAAIAASTSGTSKPLGVEHTRGRGKTEAYPTNTGSPQQQQQQREQDGWKKMKNFFSASAHPLPSTSTTTSSAAPSAAAQSTTIESLQAQLHKEATERARMEEELKEFRKKAGYLMYQLKQRYVECYESNKSLNSRNEKLEQELCEIKGSKGAAGTTAKPTVPPRGDRKDLSAQDADALKSPRAPPITPRGVAAAEPNDFMARERQLEAKEKKEWRNTRMMMVESHKIEKLELMAQVEELKDKLKNLTKDLLEVLDENEKLVRQLEAVEDERDRCIKLLESKIS